MKFRPGVNLLRGLTLLALATPLAFLWWPVVLPLAVALAGLAVAAARERRQLGDAFAGVEVRRSMPTVVVAPCPGRTTTSSSIGRIFSLIDCMSCPKSPPGRSVRPIEPWKRWSPENKMGGAPSRSRRKHTEPCVWPGVCRHVNVIPAPRTCSPSSMP